MVPSPNPCTKKLYLVLGAQRTRPADPQSAHVPASPLRRPDPPTASPGPWVLPSGRLPSTPHPGPTRKAKWAQLQTHPERPARQAPHALEPLTPALYLSTKATGSFRNLGQTCPGQGLQSSQVTPLPSTRLSPAALGCFSFLKQEAVSLLPPPSAHARIPRAVQLHPATLGPLAGPRPSPMSCHGVGRSETAVAPIQSQCGAPPRVGRGAGGSGVGSIPGGSRPGWVAGGDCGQREGQGTGSLQGRPSAVCSIRPPRPERDPLEQLGGGFQTNARCSLQEQAPVSAPSCTDGMGVAGERGRTGLWGSPGPSEVSASS